MYFGITYIPAMFGKRKHPFVNFFEKVISVTLTYHGLWLTHLKLLASMDMEFPAVEIYKQLSHQHFAAHNFKSLKNQIKQYWTKDCSKQKEAQVRKLVYVFGLS